MMRSRRTHEQDTNLHDYVAELNRNVINQLINGTEMDALPLLRKYSLAVIFLMNPYSSATASHHFIAIIPRNRCRIADRVATDEETVTIYVEMNYACIYCGMDDDEKLWK